MPDSDLDAAVDSKPARPARPRSLFRFSLAWALLAMALLITIISHVYTSRRLKIADQEVLQLRNELGHVIVSDPERVHVRSIRRLQSNTWRWRVYFPPGGKYCVKSTVRAIPDEGFPKPSSALYGGFEGEVQIDVAAYETRRGKWEFVVMTPNGRGARTLPDDHALVAPGHKSSRSTEAGQEETESVAPGEPLVLLRLRGEVKDAAGKVIGPSIDSNQPVDGLMVWIEEQQ